MRTSFNISLVFLLFVLVAFQTPKPILKKVTKEIKNTFQIENFTQTPIVINHELSISVTKLIDVKTFNEIQVNDKLLGYAYIAKAPSKTDQFDYLVLFNPQLEIIKVKVLVYREDYGNEIGSKRWLKQFIGKTSNDNLIYGNNVDAISGATISANSMTRALDQMLQGVSVLKSNKVL